MKTITVTVPAGEIGCYSGPYSIANERVSRQMSVTQVEALKILIKIAGYRGIAIPFDEQLRLDRKIREAQNTLGIEL